MLKAIRRLMACLLVLLLVYVFKFHDWPFVTRSADGSATFGATPSPNAALPPVTPVDSGRFTSETVAQQEAMRLFPALRVAGSEFNRTFLARHQQYQQYHPEFLHDPGWPVLLAREVDSSLSVASSRELPLPPSGETRDFSGSVRLVPLEIFCSHGLNYLVKLTYPKIEASVMTVFVRGGDTIRVNAPLGTYTLKYAMGDKWYGYGALFGPTTHYSKTDTVASFSETGADLRGCSITLDTVVDGHLRTETIKTSVLTQKK